jgi:O-antigen ligase
MSTVKPINQIAISIQLVLIFVTIILGIIWQGGELFWFGPAAFSAFSLFLYYLDRNYQQNLIIPKSIISLLVISFTIWCFLTVLWSDIPAISLMRAFTIGSSVIGLYCYFLITNQSLSWDIVWRSVISAGLILFVYSCVEVYLGINPPNSLFFNKNTHAAYLNLIILPTSAYFLLAQDSRNKIFLALSVFALEFSHALPGSRGATAGQIIGLIMILIVGKQYFSRKILLQFLGIYLSALSLATLLTTNLMRFFEYQIKDADLGRIEIWEGSINLLRDTPWYGGGIGTYWLTQPAYRHINDPSAGQNAHNDYLQFLIEAGIPGLILLVLLILSILYYWIKFIRLKDVKIHKKIEATSLIAGITSIGFHSFFTFNLGLFSILFLIGLMLGRFLFLINHSRSIDFLTKLQIRKPVFRLALSGIFIALSCYFCAISIFSHLYIKGESAYINGKVTKADELISIAMTLYPYDDRPYLFYAQTYLSILKKVNELSEQKKQSIFDKSISYIYKARQINPLRVQSYYLEARLYEQLQMLSGSDWKQKADQLYQKSLKINPRFLPASENYAKFLLKRGDNEKAADVVYKAITYWHFDEQKTLDFYNFAEKIIAQSDNPTRLDVLKHKKDLLELNLNK